MKTLKHGDYVKYPGIKYRPEITVGTIEGYARQYNEDPQEALDRNAAYIKVNPWEAGSRPLAWTNKAAGVLVADYAGKEKWLADKAARFEAAVTLENGEVVEIEGRQYTVNVLCRANSVSDPIHFIAVK